MHVLHGLRKPAMARELSVQIATHAFRQSLKYSSYEDVSKMPWPPLLPGSFCATPTLIEYFLFITKTNKFRLIRLSTNFSGLIKLHIDS